MTRLMRLLVVAACVMLVAACTVAAASIDDEAVDLQAEIAAPEMRDVEYVDNMAQAIGLVEVS